GARLCGRILGGFGGMIAVVGSMAGHWGTLATRSRHACRSFGDICDQRSAFLRNAARSVEGMLANSVNACRHWTRCAGGRLLKVSNVFSICLRSTSERVLSVFCFSPG